MDDLERGLQDMLSRRAEGVRASQPGRRASAVRSARRRRSARATLTAGLCILVLSTSVPLARSFGDRSPPPNVAGDPDDGSPGSYDFTWRAGEEPTIATGGFRDITWSLAMDKQKRGYDPGDTNDEDRPFLDLAIDGSSQASMVPRLDRYDVAETFSLPLEGEQTTVVFGLVNEDAATANIETELGDEYEVAIFDGPEEPNPDASYFIVFYPGTPADIVIRDTDGIELDRTSLADRETEDEEEFDGKTLTCVTFAEETLPEGATPEPEAVGDDLAFEWEEGESSQIAHGRFGRQEWSLSTATRAEPYEGESDGSGSYDWLDLRLAPESEDAAMPDHLEGTDPIEWTSWMLDGEPAMYAYGVVTEEAASAALEIDNGMTVDKHQIVELPLFDGPEESESDYFVAFYRDEPTRILIRDEEGIVIAREWLAACTDKERGITEDGETEATVDR